MKRFTALLLFCLCLHFSYGQVRQINRIQSYIEEEYQIDVNNILNASSLTVTPDPLGSYTVIDANTIIPHRTGTIHIPITVTDSDNVEHSLNYRVEVVGEIPIYFENSDADYYRNEYKITKWTFDFDYIQLETTPADTNVVISTQDKDSVLFYSEKATLYKVTAGNTYEVRYRLKSSDASNAKVKVDLTFGTHQIYDNKTFTHTSISDADYTEYSFQFESGFNGSCGMRLTAYNKNMTYWFDYMEVQQVGGDVLECSNCDFSECFIPDSLKNWNASSDLYVSLGENKDQTVAGNSFDLAPSSQGQTYISEKKLTVKQDAKYRIAFDCKSSIKNAGVVVSLVTNKSNTLVGKDTIVYAKNKWNEYSGTKFHYIEGNTSYAVKFEFLNKDAVYSIDNVRFMETLPLETPTPYSYKDVSSSKELENALNGLNRGDLITIEGGEYVIEAKIDGATGTEEDPIIIQPAAGQEVLIHGTYTLGNTWSKVKDGTGAWKIKTEDYVQQLWIIPSGEEPQMQTMARWPNIKSNFTQPIKKGYSARETEPGTSWDFNSVWLSVEILNRKDNENVYADHAEWTNADEFGRTYTEDYTGGMIVLKMGYEAVPERILSVDLANQIIHSTVNNYQVLRNAGGKQVFYVTAHRKCLDQPGEWYYDNDTQELYYIPEAGVDPNTLTFAAKNKDVAMSFTNCSGVTIQDLNFFGTTVQTDECTAFKIDNCKLNYPCYIPLAVASHPDRYSLDYGGKTIFKNTNIHINNCEISYFDGYGLKFDGNGKVTPKVTNCLIRHGRWAHAVQMRFQNGAYFARNEVYFTERGNGVKFTSSPGYFKGEYNILHDVATHRSDASMFQLSTGSQPYDTVRYNWFYNSENKGVRCDGEPGGQRASMDHNVGWHLWQGLQVKGSYHSVLNNTLFDNGKRADISILSAKDFGGNEGTKCHNNAAERLTGHRVRPVQEHPLPGIHSHNWNGYYTQVDIRDQIRDPDNFDFRPKPNSVLVDAGTLDGLDDYYLPYIGENPDQGAYEGNSDYYWIPGRMHDKASHPVPPNGSTTCFTDLDIMWLEGFDAVRHKVYFGTNPDKLPLVADIETNKNIYNPGLLDQNTVYYWRVDEVLADGSVVTGDVWFFIPAGTKQTGDNTTSCYEEEFCTTCDNEFVGWESVNASNEFQQVYVSEPMDNVLKIFTNLSPDPQSEFIRLPGINLKLKEMPLMKFEYELGKSFTDATVSVRVTDENDVVSDWYDFTISKDATGRLTRIENLSPLFDKWEAEHGEFGYAKHVDISFWVPNDIAGDGANGKKSIIVDELVLGYCVADDMEKEISIIGQVQKGGTENKKTFVGIQHVTLGVKLPELPVPNEFVVVNPDDLPGSPYIEVLPATDDTYNLDGIIVTPLATSNDYWHINVKAISGELETPVYPFVLDKEKFTALPIITICSGDSVKIFGEYQKQTGAYQHVYKAISGMDSVVLQELVVQQAVVNNLDPVIICTGSETNILGQMQSEPGLYEKVLKTVHGCDSIVRQELIVQDIYENTLPEIFICKGESVAIFGKLTSEPGTYEYHFDSDNYCDSIVYQTVSYHEVHTVVSLNGDKLQSEDLTALKYQWFDCTSGMTVLSGENASSITVEKGKTYQLVITSADNCIDTSICTNGQIITQTIYLQEGWNLVSLNIKPTENFTGTVFPNATTIKTDDVFWNASYPPFLNSLTTIEAGKGYLVYNEIDEIIEVSGTQINTSKFQYNVLSGWSLIGCPYHITTPFSNLFNSTNTLIIKDFDGFWEPEGAFNSINSLEPGKGYFIKR